MNLSKKIIYLMCAGAVFGSCMQDDDDDNCRQDQITVSVKDKNYANISEIPGLTPADENLSFASYVNPLTLWWNKAGSQEAEFKKIETGSSDKDVVLDTRFLSKGSYQIALVGNEDIQAQLLRSETFSRELHPGNKEYADIYIGTDDLTIPLAASKTTWLYRAKGMLVVNPVNLPAEITQMNVLATGIYKTVDRKLNYAGTTDVSKSFNLLPRAGETLLEFLLAPTTNQVEASLVIELVDADENTIRLSNIPLRIERNKITAIKPEYDPDEDEWELSVLIDGEWSEIHDLQVQLI